MEITPAGEADIEFEMDMEIALPVDRDYFSLPAMDKKTSPFGKRLSFFGRLRKWDKFF